MCLPRPACAGVWEGGVVTFACSGPVGTAGSLVDPHSACLSLLPYICTSEGKSESRKILTPIFSLHLKELRRIITHLFFSPQLSLSPVCN